MPTRTGRRLCAAALAMLLAAAPAAATVIVVDIERVMRETAAAGEIARIERASRRALRERLDELKAALEAEEAELSRLRDEGMPREAFGARVAAFDRRVRRTRASAQQALDAFAARFREARAALRARLDPVLDALMTARGAEVALDVGAAIRATPAADVTDEAIRRLDAALPAAAAASLLPPAAPLPPAPARAPSADDAPSAFAPAED